MKSFWVRSSTWIAVWLLAAATSLASDRQSGPFDVRVEADIPYAAVDGVKLLLDLHRPANVENPPLVMFIHGGGFRNGDRKRCKLAWIAEHGYAVASIEYRLSGVARFPAQIHDCKGALRWLRAHQQELGVDATRVVVAGTSAGGNLAALLAVSGGVDELEGTTAGHLEQSSRVEGAIDYYGPTDFLFRSKTQPAKTDDPAGSIYQLLGGPVRENRAAARLASPIHHVGPGDPPLLILHGDQDEVVFLAQSERLAEAYRAADLDVHLHVAAGEGHGWKGPTNAERELVLGFLDKCFRSD